jgi:hypothetical protein
MDAMVDPRVGRLWDQLETEERKAAVEKKRLQEIWQRVAQMHKVNEDARREFEEEACFDFVPPSTRIVLNVGGHVFETTAQVLTRDRFSLLAALCKRRPPIEPDPTGAFFLDRDWWVFRYVLQFLRGGGLPSDTELLKEMGAESSFYRLAGLHRAIEIHMRNSFRAPHPSDEPNRDEMWNSAEPQEEVGKWASPPLPDPHQFTKGSRWHSASMSNGPSKRHSSVL